MASSPSQLTNFLRQWQVVIQTQGGTYTLASGPYETLRVQFEIRTYMLLVFWECTLTIINMANQTASAIMSGAPTGTQLWQQGVPISAGDTVTISAGYQYGSSGAFSANTNQIYQGQVLQAKWLRVGVVDTTLVLVCVTGLLQDTLSFVSTSTGVGSNDYENLQTIAGKANITIPSGAIDSASQTAMSQSKYPRAQVFHGRPYDLIGSILKQNGLMGWVSSNGLHVRQFGSGDFSTPDFVYGAAQNAGGVSSPATASINSNVINSGGQAPANTRWTIIGTPEQTQYGITFRVLMDSGPKIGDIVQLAPGTLVNPINVQIGQLPPVPSQSGIYAVAGVNYVGDSRGRGDDWYTEITGLVQDFFSLLNSASLSATNNTSGASGG